MRDCSESEGEGGAGPARRTRSVAPAARRRQPAAGLSASSAQLSISSSDLRGGGRSARAAPALCQHHRPPHVCRRRPCDALHLCRLYVDGFCPRDDATCPWGHAVTSADNRRALAAYQLETMPERELLWLVRALLRQTAPVSVEEYRRQLALCAEYTAGGQCRRPECFRMHLCPRLVAGVCRNDASCRWSHSLSDPGNVMVRLRLKCADLSDSEVLTRLARQPNEDGVEASNSSDGGNCRPSEDRRPASSSIKDPISSTKTPNTSTNGQLGKNGKQLARNLELCQYNIHPSVCPEDCGQLHLCRFYVAEMCPFDRSCESGHSLHDSPYNLGVLRKHGLHQVSETELLEAIRAGYLSRNPLTDLERRFVLQICHPYQTGHCRATICVRIHICEQYVLGACKTATGCGLSHQLNNPSHAAIIRRLGLSSLSHGELLDVLSNPPSAKDVWLSVVYLSDTPDPVSDDFPTLCAVHSSGGRCVPSECENFHLCGYFLANLCHRPDDSCPLGHFFDSVHNQRVMELHGLLGGSADHFQELIDWITLRERITFANNAQTDVRMCIPYNSARGCAEHCGRFHVCYKYLVGSRHGKDCELRHDLAGAHNRRVREVLGLAASADCGRDEAWATDRDLTELLRARLGVKPGVYPSPEFTTNRLPTSALSRPSEITRIPSVCGRLSAGMRCPNARCAAVHICPHFLAGACRRQNCTLGHQLNTDRNQQALQLSGRTVTAENHDSLLEELFAASPHIPRPDVYKQLRICIRHNQNDGCHVSDCINIHICQKFIAGTCGSDCDLGHVVDTKRNKKKLRALCLEDVSVDDVLEMLRAVHGFRSAYSP